MARKLRLEAEGSVFHVLNRGNYRGFIFQEASAKNAFLGCLDEACQKTGWIVHAWALMENHFHLAVETPVPNLAEGMKWLQGTFAARFNRYRRESGHLFQGRYKALIVDPGEGLGALCHYIHLNPVRAKCCPVEELPRWQWTCMAWLVHPAKRANWYDPKAALDHAGALKDTSAGRRKYLEYLRWLAEDDPARKRMRFDRMSKGWVIGSKEFKKALLKEHLEVQAKLELGDRELTEFRDEILREKLAEALGRLGKTSVDIASEGKSVPWKLAAAALMKKTTTARNQWLSENLQMGNVSEVSRKVNAWMRSPDVKLQKLLEITPNPKT
jgi:putative transposase